MDVTLGHEMGNDFFIMFRRLSDELWQRLLAVLNYGVAGKNPEFVLSCFTTIHSTFPLICASTMLNTEVQKI